MGWHIPQFHRAFVFVPLDKHEALADKHQVYFVEPPHGRTGHLIERVGMLHQVEERVFHDLCLGAVRGDAIQMPVEVGEIACDALYHRQTRAL